MQEEGVHGKAPAHAIERVLAWQITAQNVYGHSIVMIASPAASGFKRAAPGDNGPGGHHLVVDLAVRAPHARNSSGSVSGQTDAVLMLRLKDIEEFEPVCERLLRNLSNVARYYTMFVTQTAKEATAMPL